MSDSIDFTLHMQLSPAGALAEVSASTIRRMVDLGTLRSFKDPSGQRWVLREDVERWRMPAGSGGCALRRLSPPRGSVHAPRRAASQRAGRGPFPRVVHGAGARRVSRCDEVLGV
jgi:hypothetical protein